MSIAVKICGIRDDAALAAALVTQASYIGFVHYPASPRHISIDVAAGLITRLPANTNSVVVLVNPDDELIAQAAKAEPNYLQLHGSETPERILEIKKLAPECKIIKAISVSNADDIEQAKHYKDCADALLFDAKPAPDANLPGGNGIAFDWSLLSGKSFSCPWFLSGGLGAQNVAEAIKQSGAKMIDVSSGVESAAGVKDSSLINAFMKATHSV